MSGHFFGLFPQCWIVLAAESMSQCVGYFCVAGIVLGSFLDHRNSPAKGSFSSIEQVRIKIRTENVKQSLT